MVVVDVVLLVLLCVVLLVVFLVVGCQVVVLLVLPWKHVTLATSPLPQVPLFLARQSNRLNSFPLQFTSVRPNSSLGSATPYAEPVSGTPRE